MTMYIQNIRNDYYSIVLLCQFLGYVFYTHFIYKSATVLGVFRIVYFLIHHTIKIRKYFHSSSRRSS